MNWQTFLENNLTTAEDLRSPLKLTDEEYENIRQEIACYPMSVTKYYFSLINPDDPDDPIRKLAIPTGNTILPDGELDTSGEAGNTVLQGMQHKYAETVLILTTADCAMFCRHCFRRRLVGKSDEEIAVDIDAIADYIQAHPSINNVLLSGGDSFLLPTEEIADWLRKLAALPQLDFIRFGTRTPVTFPQRILGDYALLELLASYRQQKQLYVVTHFNHPREITPESQAAVRALRGAGVIVKNQTVLLRGINDDPEVLAELLRKITSIGVVQHYIFQCRPVKGVKSQFQVPIVRGSDIVQKALAKQNGLGKSADYTMSHVKGKVRILGRNQNGEMIFQFRQAKNAENIGRIFSRKLDGTETWLPDDFEI